MLSKAFRICCSISQRRAFLSLLILFAVCGNSAQLSERFIGSSLTVSGRTVGNCHLVFLGPTGHVLAVLRLRP